MGIELPVMQPYFDLIDYLRRAGKEVVNQRTGERCYYVSSAHLEFEGHRGFLANTRRQLGSPHPEDPNKWLFKSPFGEFIGLFCRGFTNAADFEKVGTKVWYANANETPGWLNNPFRKGENDLGQIYQFREYTDLQIADGDAMRDLYLAQGYEVAFEEVHSYYCMRKVIHQLDNLLHTLLTNPTDRRMIVSAWHLGTIDKCALPPCHHTYTFTANEGAVLDIECNMRSWDVHLAFNIQITHLFLLVVCRLVGMRPGKVVINASNAHLYENALPAVDEMLKRECLPAPTLVLSEWVKPVAVADNSYIGAFDRINPEDIWLEGYQAHPAIKTDMVA
jgi:thymidylate synthase